MCRGLHPDGRTYGRMDSVCHVSNGGAWLAQHFYLHWKYSADKEFLKERAYPFLKDVAVYMEQKFDCRQ